MATPPPQSRAITNVNTYTIEEKGQLLENFDLEVEDKIRAFESHLALTLQSFLLRQDSELFRIPRELRTMTLRDLQASWGGSLAETMKKLKRDRIEQEERERMEREEEERRIKENDAKKRKLEEEANSPGQSKNARKEGKTTMTASSSKNVKRKPPIGKKGKSAPSRTSSSQPSALPQNHIFNPLLPPTPKMPRAPRRGESFMSINGSPLADPDDNIEDRDSDDDLPDPEAYEARLTKSQRQPQTSKTKSSKRGPSLLFRQSLAPNRLKGDEDQDQDQGEIRTIQLKDGRVISFNPLQLDPERIEDEMLESGMEGEERDMVRNEIKAEVVKALSERMERWSGLR